MRDITGQDTLRLFAATPDDLTLEKRGLDLVIHVFGQPTLRVRDNFVAPDAGLQTIVFQASQTTWSRADMLARLVSHDPAPPQAIDDSVSTEMDTPLTLQPATNDRDINADDVLTVARVVSPTEQGGHVAIVDDGAALRYTPPTGFTGEDRFTYRVTDGRFTSGDGTVAVSVTPVEHAPYATVHSATELYAAIERLKADSERRPLERIVYAGTQWAQGEAHRYNALIIADVEGLVIEGAGYVPGDPDRWHRLDDGAVPNALFMNARDCEIRGFHVRGARWRTGDANGAPAGLLYDNFTVFANFNRNAIKCGVVDVWFEDCSAGAHGGMIAFIPGSDQCYARRVFFDNCPGNHLYWGEGETWIKPTLDDLRSFGFPTRWLVEDCYGRGYAGTGLSEASFKGGDSTRWATGFPKEMRGTLRRCAIFDSPNWGIEFKQPAIIDTVYSVNCNAPDAGLGTLGCGGPFFRGGSAGAAQINSGSWFSTGNIFTDAYDEIRNWGDFGSYFGMRTYVSYCTCWPMPESFNAYRFPDEGNSAEAFHRTHVQGLWIAAVKNRANQDAEGRPVAALQIGVGGEVIGSDNRLNFDYQMPDGVVDGATDFRRYDGEALSANIAKGGPVERITFEDAHFWCDSAAPIGDYEYFPIERASMRLRRCSWRGNPPGAPVQQWAETDIVEYRDLPDDPWAMKAGIEDVDGTFYRPREGVLLPGMAWWPFMGDSQRGWLENHRVVAPARYWDTIHAEAKDRWIVSPVYAAEPYAT